MKKVFKKVTLAFLFAVLLITSFSMAANSADQFYYDGSYSRKESGKTKNYFVYHSINTYTYVNEKNAAWGPQYVNTKNGTTKFTVEKAVTYKSQATTTFSGNLGLKIGNDIVSGSVGIAGGRSSTSELTISKGTKTTKQITKNMASGYYMFTSCVNYKKIKVNKWSTGKNGKLEKTMYFYMPTGLTYEALCYSSNGNYNTYKVDKK